MSDKLKQVEQLLKETETKIEDLCNDPFYDTAHYELDNDIDKVQLDAYQKLKDIFGI